MDKHLRERRNQIQQHKDNPKNTRNQEPLNLPQFQPILKEFTDNQPNNDGKIIRPTPIKYDLEKDIIQETCNEPDYINSESDDDSVGEQGDIDEIIDTGFWDSVVKHHVNPEVEFNILINVIYDYEDVYNRNFTTDLEPKLYEYIHRFYEKIESQIKDPVKGIVTDLKTSMEKKHQERENIIKEYVGPEQKEETPRQDNTCSPGSVKRTILTSSSNSAFTRKPIGGKKKKKLNKTNKVKKSKNLRRLR